MTDEELLVEVKDLIRTIPPQSTFVASENHEVLAWLGRVAAVLDNWNSLRSISLRVSRHISTLQSAGVLDLLDDRNEVNTAYRALVTTLHQAQYDLTMKTTGPVSMVIDSGRPYDYFDELRKIIETARIEIWFIDPYLDASFVSQFMTQIVSEVNVRLLTSARYIESLVPAVTNWAVQNRVQMDLRLCSTGLHDRFVFIDDKSCYQSSASFKDGTRKNSATIIQVTDTFEALYSTYNSMWENARAIEINNRT